MNKKINRNIKIDYIYGFFPICCFIADNKDLHFVFLGLGILQLLIMIGINWKRRKAPIH